MVQRICVLVTLLGAFAMMALAGQSSNPPVVGKLSYKSLEGRNAFARRMEGVSNQSFGLKLPEGITLDELSQLVFGKKFSELKAALTSKYRESVAIFKV